MSTVGIAVFIAVTAILLVVTIPVRKELLSVNSDYLYMTAQMYGQRMETAVNLTQYDIDIRKVPFRLESFLQNAKMADCESSYCYLVRSDGITLYHPNHDKIGRTAEVEAIKNIATSLGSGNASDIVEYNIDGQDEIAAYYASSKGFVLVVAVEKADFLATLNKMTMIVIITGVVIFVVMLSFGLYQALRITKPIETVAEVVDQIGDLDFTGDERTGALLTRKDETGVIAESVEEMREKLVGIVQKIQSQSTILYNTSQDLYQSARDTNDDASHIEQAVGDIATGASSQADETQKANVDVGVIGEMIIDTSNQVSELTETANAIDVLGTDDPVVVQNELSDWNGFDHVADLANKKGYHMLSGPVETFRVFSNNVTQTWVDDPSSVSPKIQVDSKLIEWADMCKKYTENGWIGDNEQWTDGWNFDQSAEGKVFGFFMSTWGINFTLVGNAGEEGFGDWAVCEGPAAWYWGGTWISGARGTDNKELVVDIMRKLTCDKDNMVKMSGETQDYTNTVSGMETLAASDYKSDFLSGQNHIKLFSQAAPKIDMSKVGPYDHGLNEVFQKQMGDYIGGKCDKQTAINNFLKNAVVKYPELTYDPITVQ